MLDNVSLVISGPISSRLSQEIVHKTLDFLLQLREQTNLEILLSTYPNEVPAIYLKELLVIENEDPGKDSFEAYGKTKRLHGPKVERNTSRLIETTLNGISKCTREFAIKSRVEMLPKSLHFATEVSDLLEQWPTSQKIISFDEHFHGFSRPTKGVYFWLTDIFQIMKTEDMLLLWSTAEKFWNSYKEVWHRHSNSVPLSTEQVIGLAFFSAFGKELDNQLLCKIHKYKLNMDLLANQMFLESGPLRTITVRELSLDLGRFVYNKNIKLARYDNVSLPRYSTSKKNVFLFIFISRVYRFRYDVLLKNHFVHSWILPLRNKIQQYWNK